MTITCVADGFEGPPLVGVEGGKELDEIEPYESSDVDNMPCSLSRSSWLPLPPIDNLSLPILLLTVQDLVIDD